MDLEALKSLLEENARRTWNPLGVRESLCGEWAKGLNLPRRGEYLLYTGCLYQMVPYIRTFSDLMRRLERAGSTALRLAFGLNSIAVKLGIDTTSLIGITIPKREKERYFNILRTIARALKSVGIDFAYIRDEPYNGVLYYDLGMDGVFSEHVRRLARRISETGAKKIVTVDPHTTYMLRHLIHKFVDDFDAEVIYYADLLLERGYEPRAKGVRDVVVHDPCYLARWNGPIDRLRELLRKAGIEVREPEFSREFTGCCGGPIESVFPSLASAVAVKRLHELKEAGGNDILVACPICLANLGRESGGVGVRVYDVAEVLV